MTGMYVESVTSNFLFQFFFLIWWLMTGWLEISQLLNLIFFFFTQIINGSCTVCSSSQMFDVQLSLCVHFSTLRLRGGQSLWLDKYSWQCYTEMDNRYAARFVYKCLFITKAVSKMHVHFGGVFLSTWTVREQNCFLTGKAFRTMAPRWIRGTA